MDRPRPSQRQQQKRWADLGDALEERLSQIPTAHIGDPQDCRGRAARRSSAHQLGTKGTRSLKRRETVGPPPPNSTGEDDAEGGAVTAGGCPLSFGDKRGLSGRISESFGTRGFFSFIFSFFEQK